MSLAASLASNNSPLQTREKLYLLAIGYYRSGDYSRSRQLAEQCLVVWSLFSCYELVTGRPTSFTSSSFVFNVRLLLIYYCQKILKLSTMLWKKIWFSSRVNPWTWMLHVSFVDRTWLETGTDLEESNWRPDQKR